MVNADTQTDMPASGFSIEGHQITATPVEAGLHLTATPIGNLGDITLRALNTLAAVDLIYCEDTRITSRLLQRYQITTPMKPYHDHNGAKVRPKIVESLKAGQKIALVSDAGTPLVSDPGFKLVALAYEQNLPVHMSPGVSAPIVALALSGFATDAFQFRGFLAPKSAARKKQLAACGDYGGVTLFFESPKRLKACLKDICEVLPEAQVSVGRELTKRFEEVSRGPVLKISQEFSARATIKGEITLAIWPGEQAKPGADDLVVAEAVADAVQTMSASKAAHFVANRFGLQKRQLYDLAVTLAKKNKQA